MPEKELDLTGESSNLTDSFAVSNEGETVEVGSLNVENLDTLVNSQGFDNSEESFTMEVQAGSQEFIQNDMGAVSFEAVQDGASQNDVVMPVSGDLLGNMNDEAVPYDNVEQNVGDNVSSGIDFSDNTGVDYSSLETQGQIDQSIFLETSSQPVLTQLEENENYGGWLRLFFVSMIFLTIGLVCLGIEFSFNLFLKKAVDLPVDASYESYVSNYKTYFKQVKGWFGFGGEQYSNLSINDTSFNNTIQQVVRSNDIDYIEKRDLLKPIADSLKSDIVNKLNTIEDVKKETATQGFLPEEIKGVLANEGGIDTIQRSLNALEIIKFSTATKVFSYMNTALETITYMVGRNGIDKSSIINLLKQATSRGEKDISAYVYLCYLNPFEVDSNCNVIGDLDLYYKLNNQNISMDLSLFKKVMNAINQLLENEDTAMFSITFNGFDATAEDITFNIEVFTNQSDEKALISQGIRNPSIFIITNISNLLKLSTFIIGAQMETKEVNIEQQTQSVGGVVTTVNYSKKSFTVPIQKNMEREIFDYIDITNLKKILKKSEGNNYFAENVDKNESVR